MRYDEKKARKLVIEAGHKLIEKKLIARTWGNISARISDNEFVITPSGRAYEALTPEELVVVKADTLEYTGEIKPSSEKGIHAAAYLQRKDCNFVIHTHQFYASAICSDEMNTIFAPCAKYGLSGTKKLRNNVEEVICKYPDKKSFLMAKHGAVLLGDTYEEAFRLADELEKKCEKLFHEEEHIPRKGIWLDDYAQMFNSKGVPNKGEDPEAIELVRAKNDAASRYAKTIRRVPRMTAFLEHLVYTIKYSKLKDKK